MVSTQVASHADQTCILLLLVLASVLALASASGGQIGVDYGLNGDDLLTPEQTVKLLLSRGIMRVRTFEARPDVTQAFANSGIHLIIGVPNEDVPAVAASAGEALNWVTKYVLPFPTSGISAIIVGNEWLSDRSNNFSVLVPAMRNIYEALLSLRLDSGIKVSTAHSMAVLSKSYPPSAGTFADQFVAVMRSLLEFLDKTGSFFMVSIFPYFAYLADEGVSLEFALFESTQVVTDPNTGLNYTNLFDMQLDAVYAAIASLSTSANSGEVEKASDEHVHVEPKGAPSPKVVPGETGWSSGNHDVGTPPYHPPHSPHHSISALSDDFFTHITMPPALTHAYATSTSSSKLRSGVTSSSSLSLTSPLPSTSMASSSSSSMTSSSANVSNNSNGNQNVSSLSSPSSRANVSPIDISRRVSYAVEEAQEYVYQGTICECSAATVEYARTYNQNLIQHVLEAEGTPANPTTPIEAYIFELFNEDLKPRGTEQHYGLFFPNGTAVYPICFSSPHG